jgi:hypothetical protein
MPDVVRRHPAKTDTTKVVKQQVVKTAPVAKQDKKTVTKVVVSSPKVLRMSTKTSTISPTKIKKILDEERMNRDVISIIKTIKTAIAENREVKKELTETQLEVVGEYINKHKAKLQTEEKNGKNPSTNEVALRAFMDQKYKFKKDLSVYLGMIADLMVEEVISVSMKHVLTVGKKLINTTHIVGGQLSSGLLYPLYCKLPSFVELSTSMDVEETENTTKSDSLETEQEKASKYFMGNIKTIFNSLKTEETSSLKIQKKYQEFLSNLVVEFLERLIHPLMVTVQNNSRNKVIAQSTGETVIDIFMSDYVHKTSRYPELLSTIQKRSQ